MHRLSATGADLLTGRGLMFSWSPSLTWVAKSAELHERTLSGRWASASLPPSSGFRQLLFRMIPCIPFYCKADERMHSIVRVSAPLRSRDAARRSRRPLPARGARRAGGGGGGGGRGRGARRLAM